MKRITNDKFDLDKVMSDLNNYLVKAGYFKQSVYPDGTPIAYVAAVQELGHTAGGIPPRPTLRPAFSDEHRAEYSKLVRLAVNNALKGIPLEEGLAVLGEVVSARVKQNISSLSSPPLKDSTIRAKGSNKPLVDTGQMIQAVNYSVELKGE